MQCYYKLNCSINVSELVDYMRTLMLILRSAARTFVLMTRFDVIVVVR